MPVFKLEEVDRMFEMALYKQVVAMGYFPDKMPFIGSNDFAGFEAAKAAIIDSGNEICEVYGVGNYKARGRLDINRITVDRMTPVPANLSSTNDFQYIPRNALGATHALETSGSYGGNFGYFIATGVGDVTSEYPTGASIILDQPTAEDKTFTVLISVFTGTQTHVAINEAPSPMEPGAVLNKTKVVFDKYLKPGTVYDIEYQVHWVCQKTKYDRILEHAIRTALGGQRKRLPLIDDSGIEMDNKVLITFNGEVDLSGTDFIERVKRYVARDVFLDDKVLIATDIPQYTKSMFELGITLHPENVDIITGELGAGDIGNVVVD